MSEAIQPFPATAGGATSLSHQDSPPTYDAAMAASCDAGRLINPSGSISWWIKYHEFLDLHLVLGFIYVLWVAIVVLYPFCNVIENKPNYFLPNCCHST